MGDKKRGTKRGASSLPWRDDVANDDRSEEGDEEGNEDVVRIELSNFVFELDRDDGQCELKTDYAAKFQCTACAIVTQTVAGLGKLLKDLENGAEQNFKLLLGQVSQRFMLDVTSDDTAQKDLDMVAFKRVRSQELATRKYGADRSALVSVTRAMQPLCDLGEKYQAFGDSKGPEGIMSVNPRPSDITQCALAVFAPQATIGTTISKLSNKFGQNVHKLMKERYSEPSDREELRRIRSASLTQLCSELKEYCTNGSDAAQGGLEVDQGEVAAESSKSDVGSAKSKKKKKPWYDSKEGSAVTYTPTLTRPPVRSTWLPQDLEESTHNDEPWEEVKASSVSKSGGPTGKRTVESQGPFAHYGWDFNDVFYRGLVIGSESKFSRRSTKPGPDFGTDSLLKPDAGKSFGMPKKTVGENAFSDEQSEAREEWLKGAEQRQASWAKVWDKSVLSEMVVEPSDVEDTEIIEDSSLLSNADDAKSNLVDDPDLPEGVITNVPLAEYIGELQL